LFFSLENFKRIIADLTIYLVKSTVNMLPEEVVSIKIVKEVYKSISTKHFGGEQ